MCTAVVYHTKDHYFGRNLDYEFAYHQTVTVTPRKYPFHFRRMGDMPEHYAMIGMAFVQQNTPLYYDAVNEKSLGMAGLNFPGYADYKAENPSADNVPPFEFIPWILGQCANVKEAREKLARMNMLNEDFSKELPASPLHWMIADRQECIVAESVKDGLKIYDNPAGVLTNSPDFPYHLTNLTNYMAVSPADPQNRFAPDIPLSVYSRGMGSMGLPGDLSSASRFVKAAFTRANSLSGDSESESVSQFFHILESVAQQRGCCRVEHGWEYTLYSACCNMDTGVYYYTTYENSQITGVDMYKENINGTELAAYPLLETQNILMQN